MKKLEKLLPQTFLENKNGSYNNMSKIISHTSTQKDIAWWTTVHTSSYGGDYGQVHDRAHTAWGDAPQWNY